MVLKEIEGLESDIEKLRSQVQKGSRMIVESDDSTEDEFVPHQAYESRIQRVHQQHHVPMTHFDHHANGKCLPESRSTYFIADQNIFKKVHAKKTYLNFKGFLAGLSNFLAHCVLLKAGECRVKLHIDIHITALKSNLLIRLPIINPQI